MATDLRYKAVAERYAQALFDLALQHEALDAVKADLDGFSALLAESVDLRRLIAAPTVSSPDKARGLLAVAERGGADPLTRKFLGVLAGAGRAAALPAAIAAFNRRYDARRGVVAAQVTSAMKLTARQLEGVQAALRQALGQDPEITTTVDPSILGGLKVRVGSRLYDASLKTRLDSLKFALKRA